MKFSPRWLRNLTVSYSVSDLIAVSVIAAVVAVWAAFASGTFSLLALVACEAAFFSFYLVGSLFAGWGKLSAGVLFDLPLRLLMGYAFVNTALLVLAWLSPLGIIANFSILFAIAIGLYFAAPERKRIQGDSVSLWVIALSLIATTFWCQDSILPTKTEEHVLLVKPWVDGFYHAVHIRIFAASHGASTIEDFRLAGVPARLYHYGVYLLPALVKQVSGIHSFAAFAGVLAPVGVFFTGLAAYAFIGSLWGGWPGLTAAAALLLLPDGAQQGMQNTFMSYHWLTQISPSATYGLALLAVAWLFVIRGCLQGSWVQLLAGWLLSAVIVFYKFHFIVASAILLLIIPPLFFFGSFGFRKRALWATSAMVAYVAILVIGQKLPGVPLIRFDGSSIGEILDLVQSMATRGEISNYLADRLGVEVSRTTNLLLGIPYVLLAALGCLVPLLVILLVLRRRSSALLPTVFPLLLIANFLVMFFGLALDFSRSTPDELSHRPVMVVYFFVVSWIGGALGLTLIESRRLERFARPTILGLSFLLMIVPAHFGAGVQLMKAMSRISPVRLPRDLVRVAEYIRSHGSAEDVFQDSQFDRTYVVAALSERKTFAARTMTLMPFRSDQIESRVFAIDRFMGIRVAPLIGPTARTLGFRWFLLEPGDRVDWPEKVVNNPVFQSGRYRLYEF